MTLAKLLLTIGMSVAVTTTVLYLWPANKPHFGGTTTSPSTTSGDTITVSVVPDTPRESLQVNDKNSLGQYTYIGSYSYLKFTIDGLTNQVADLQAKISYYNDLLSKASAQFDAQGVPPEGTVFSTTSVDSATPTTDSPATP